MCTHYLHCVHPPTPFPWESLWFPSIPHIPHCFTNKSRKYYLQNTSKLSLLLKLF
jgi:hypothetical protein